jgi:hypothetical protein
VARLAVTSAVLMLLILFLSEFMPKTLGLDHPVLSGKDTGNLTGSIGRRSPLTSLV